MRHFPPVVRISSATIVFRSSFFLYDGATKCYWQVYVLVVGLRNLMLESNAAMLCGNDAEMRRQQHKPVATRVINRSLKCGLLLRHPVAVRVSVWSRGNEVLLVQNV